MILVYIPCPDEEEAKSIAIKLLNNRLIACANIVKSKSLFLWQDKLKDEDEHILIVKSTAEKWDDIKKAVGSYHSYKIPAIIRIDAECNEKYDRWVKGEMKKGNSDKI